MEANACPDPNLEEKRQEIADVIIGQASSLPRNELIGHLRNIGLPHLLEEVIIQSKLPETATDESLDKVA